MRTKSVFALPRPSGLLRKSRSKKNSSFTSLIEQWLDQYWQVHFKDDEKKVIEIDDMMQKFIHFLLITGEQEKIGFVNCIHNKNNILRHSE